MENCPYCERFEKGDFTHVLMADAYAITVVESNPFRKGQCIVIPRRHMTSLSEMTEEENASVFKMITATSKALEKTLSARKTYLLSIADSVRHLHYHLIPKLKGQVSMGQYAFISLLEAEGGYKPVEGELDAFLDTLVQNINEPNVDMD